jgi:hypothetical protein
MRYNISSGDDLLENNQFLAVVLGEVIFEVATLVS